MINRTNIIIVTLILIVFGSISLVISKIQSTLAEKTAIENAHIVAETLEIFRGLYTSEVIKRLSDRDDISVTHDYIEHKDAIPLPATLSMEIGSQIGDRIDGLQVRLFSKYPFPWRIDEGGLRDDFDTNAWTELSKDPTKPYLSFEQDNSENKFLRYAVADRMLDSCVNCHNAHPDTPKNDWQVGDLRGILEVRYPMQAIVAHNTENLKQLDWMMAIVGLISVIILLSSFSKINKIRLFTERSNRENIKDKRRLEEILDSSLAGIISITTKGIIQSFNKSAETLFGYTPEEVMDKNVSMLMPAGRAKEHDGYLQNFLRTGDAKVIGSGREVVGLRKDGSEFDMHLSVSEMILEDETLFLGVVTNITEEVVQRKQLAEAEERTRMIVDSSLSGIITITVSGIIQSFNKSAEALFGYTPEEVMDKNVSMLMPAGRAKEHDGYLKNFLQTGIAKVIGSGREVVGLRKDGSEFDMHLSVSVMNLDEGRVFLGLVTDITEQVAQRQRIIDSNDELQANSEELQSQQEELRVANEELVINSKALELNQKQMEAKAEELVEISRYKSEFMANMSHELRTPLNSLLILSNSLADNEDGNLSEDEVESADVIRSSGKHLLELINEILNLAKTEAGKMVVENTQITLPVLSTALNSRFSHMAADKNIDFSINISDIKTELISDESMLNHILTNLISNAIKFTSQGGVKLNIDMVESSTILAGQNKLFTFSVEDTGIGIAEDQQTVVFEAFQQADGTSSRQFGGTGLGLSIVQSYTKLLGGEIKLVSEAGKGSTFTLYLPESPSDTPKEKDNQTISPSQPAASVEFKNSPPPFDDDRDMLDLKKPLFLIVEDDEKFARILFDICHQQQSQCIVAPDGETGINLAKTYKITGIILDYMLPGMDGRAVLTALKSDPVTQQLPVHIISAVEDFIDLESFGVIGQLTKPVKKSDILEVLDKLTLSQGDNEVHLLLVEDDEANMLALYTLFKTQQVTLSYASTGQEAISLLKQQKFSAMILDLGLPDMTGFELLETLSKDDDCQLPPVIVHTGKELSDDEYSQLKEVTESIVIKSVSSPERLQDEVHLFVNTMNKQDTNTTELADINDVKLAGKTILLVDDDLRNTFALAKVLRKKDLVVHIAASGKDALKLLSQHEHIEIILMDIMMPEMDGYETMGHIRDQQKFVDLPIIALTAKAMKGDKEKCLEAGANDYLAKPIDVQKLLVMMQMWL